MFTVLKHFEISAEVRVARRIITIYDILFGRFRPPIVDAGFVFLRHQALDNETCSDISV